VIAFRALDAVLAARRPRPRWKTALVAQQNLRWARTTLLGRLPGWSPPVTAVGPWAPVSLGDYAAGSNHVLPTGGCACHSSGLSVQSFLRGVHVVAR
jgi:hypothetical protein